MNTITKAEQLRETDFHFDPFVVAWEVTRACDLACLHCRADAIRHRNPLELNTDEGYRLIDQLAEFSRKPLLIFTGGDPMKREDLFDLMGYATQQGLKVAITPSATPLVTREAIRQAKEAGVQRWAFSIDGSYAELHDGFRGEPDTFARTMAAIEHLREFEIPLQVNSTVTRVNLEDLPALARLVEDLGTVMWSVFFLVPTGRGQVSDLVSPEEHEEVLEWLAELAETAPFDIKTTEAHHYRRVVIQRRARQRRASEQAGADGGQAAATPGMPPFATPGFHLGGIGRAPKGVSDGNGFMFISHIGDVTPSGFLPVAAGNVRQQSPVEIYRNSELFTTLRQVDRLKGKCGRCEFNRICGGSRARAYALTGDVMASDPSCAYQPR